MAIDVRRKEVIIPAYTCATTLQPAILQAGGVPVFADICEDNLCMERQSLEDHLSSRTRVVISHHYYGAAASNLEDVQGFAAKHGLIHIEDCAHSLGALCGTIEVGRTGDVATFSFSKLLNCPGGGAISFKDLKLFNRAIEIQRVCGNPFHGIVTNSETLRWESAIIRDRPGSLRPALDPERILAPLFVRKVAVKLLCDSHLYRRVVFGARPPTDIGTFRPGLDTRMTRLQCSRISRMMGFLDSVVKERRRKAKLLNDVIPSYFSSLDGNIVTNYAIWAPNVEDLVLCLRGLGIRTRRVWPYFQPYWPAQMTERVNKLRDHLLLVDMDSIDDERIEILRQRRQSGFQGTPLVNQC